MAIRKEGTEPESQMHYMSRLSPDKSDIMGQPFFYGQLKVPWAVNLFMQEPRTGEN